MNIFISMKVKSLIVLMMFSLALLIIAISIRNASASSPPPMGDWIVDDTTTVSDETVVVTGNITITGHLKLQNSVIYMNCSYPAQYSIIVENEGFLEIVNSKIDALNKTYIGVIKEDGKIVIINSTISNYGKDKIGIQIRTSDATISNSYFINSTCGLNILNSTIVQNSTFFNCTYGIISTSNITVRNTSFIECSEVALYCINSTVIIENCNFSMNKKYGVRVNTSKVIARDSIFLKNYMAFEIEDSIGNLYNCKFEDNNERAVAAWFSEIFMDYVSVNDSYRIAFFSYSSKCYINLSHLEGEMYDAYLDMNSYVETLNVTFGKFGVYFKDYKSVWKASWYISVQVVWWSSLMPVENATVIIENITGHVVYSGKTNKNGIIENVRLAGYMMDKRDFKPFYPYNLTASREGIIGKTNFNLTKPISIIIMLDDVPPMLETTNLKNNDYVNKTLFNLEGVAWDNETGLRVVEVMVDSDKWKKANGTSYWNITLNLSEGFHTLKVRTFDFANNSVQIVLNLIVDITPPPLTVTSPLNGTITRENMTQIVGKSEGGAIVIINGTLVEINNITGEFTKTVVLEEGLNVFIVVAKDKAENQNVVIIHVTLDTRLYPFEIIPGNGTYLNTTNATFSGVIEKNATMTVNGKYVPVINGTFKFNLTLQEGNNTLLIQCIDVVGNVLSVKLTVFLDTTHPILNITYPPSEIYYTRNRRLVITGWVEENSEVFFNGRRVLLNNWNFSKTLTLDDGENIFTIVAVDKAGNANKVVLIVILDRIPPYINITKPKNGDETTSEIITVEGYTEPNATVEVNEKTTYADYEGHFKISIHLKKIGNNTIEVRVIDKAGNKGVKRIVVIRKEVPPLLTPLQIAAIIIGLIVVAFLFAVAYDTKKKTGHWGLQQPDWLKISKRERKIPREKITDERIEMEVGREDRIHEKVEEVMDVEEEHDEVQISMEKEELDEKFTTTTERIEEREMKEDVEFKVEEKDEDDKTEVKKHENESSGESEEAISWEEGEEHKSDEGSS